MGLGMTNEELEVRYRILLKSMDKLRRQVNIHGIRLNLLDSGRSQIKSPDLSALKILKEKDSI